MSGVTVQDGKYVFVRGLVERAGNFDPAPSKTELNTIVGSFRNAWTPVGRAGGPGGSFSLALGGNDPVLAQRVGYAASASYAYGQEAQVDQRRAVAQAEAGGETREIDRFDGSTGRESMRWGSLLNLSTLIGSHSRLMLNNTYTRTADLEARRETGFSENLASAFRIDRLRYVERAVRSNQLKGEHEIASGVHHLEWSVTQSGVKRSEPDRSEFVYSVDETDASGNELPAAWFSISNQAAVRTSAA